MNERNKIDILVNKHNRLEGVDTVRWASVVVYTVIEYWVMALVRDSL